MASDNQGLVTRFFQEVCNGRKLQAADEIFSSRHTYHDPSSPQIGPGPEGMKQLMSTYHTAFPDASWTIEETLIAGDRVITRWRGRGTNRGELAGLPPTGKSADVTGIWIHRIAAGKIAESWNSWDTLGMLAQLGVVPAFGKVRARAAP